MRWKILMILRMLMEDVNDGALERHVYRGRRFENTIKLKEAIF